MKKVLLLFALACTVAIMNAQTKPVAKKDTSSKQKAPTTTDKSKDNVDDRMKGPNGEKIYIGEKGGRYYLKNGKKVYVEYKGNKKKKA